MKESVEMILSPPINLVSRASDFVLKLMAEGNCEHNVFHNQRHTVQAVHAVKEIGLAMNLSDHEQNLIALAAWFQNVGYSFSSSDPRKSSADIATDFMTDYQISTFDRDQVLSCMGSVHQDNINGLLGKIFNDAYWFFLSSHNHLEMSDRLRQEWAYHDRIFSDQNWKHFITDLFRTHRYVTIYGGAVLEKKKMENYYAIIRKMYGASFVTCDVM